MSEVDKAIVNIAEQVCKLNLKQVVDLIDLLKKELNISDADLSVSSAPVAVGAPVGNTPVATKTEFSIILKHYADADKTKAIKAVREISQAEGMSPEEVSLIAIKRKVEALPLVICEKISKEKIDKYSAILKESNAEFVVE